MLELPVIRKRLVAVGAFLATVAATYSPAQMQGFPNRRQGTTPECIGRNPLLTISALTERIADHLIGVIKGGQ